jgi:hypothetical protein
MVSRVPSLQRHYPPSPLLNPSYTLSPFSRFPGCPGYTAYLSPVISARDEEGFSRFQVRPCLRAVAKHPAGAVHLFSQPVSVSRAAFTQLVGARPPVYLVSRPPRVHFRYGPAAHSPPQGSKHYPHPRAPSLRSHGSKMSAIGLTTAECDGEWREPASTTCVRACALRRSLSPGCRAECCAPSTTAMGILWSLPCGRRLIESCRALSIRSHPG